MEIQYLTSLRDNPTWGPYTNRGISSDKILELEQQYNNKQLFPKALRELLFLAGDLCNIFDYGLNDTQQGMQEVIKEALIRENKTIARPFYVIEVRNHDENAVFVYLDDGDNPQVREATTYPTNRQWNRSLDKTLSQFCNICIAQIKRGENPS